MPTGHPQAEFRRHHTINVGGFAPGTAYLAAAIIRQLIPIWSSSKVRIRFKASTEGTLRAYIPLPGIVPGQYASFDADDDLTTIALAVDKPTDVAVVAATEAVMELGTTGDFELAGEAYLLLEFEQTGVGAAGTITQVSVSQV